VSSGAGCQAEILAGLLDALPSPVLRELDSLSKKLRRLARPWLPQLPRKAADALRLARPQQLTRRRPACPR